MNTRQTKSGEEAPCVVEIPSGATFLENLTSYIKGAYIDNSNGSVQPTNTPLTPEFTANYVTTAKNNITITATVKIDSAVTINDLQVYQKDAIIDPNDNTKILKQLYIGYCYAEETPVGLYPYTVTFDIVAGSSLGTISEIELYLYDEDPITSSGKKVIVHPPA
ncbi:hypothetical protein [uncultured Dokdonia sp.]|uniref:hypothetical protein n=1 Tax=uncultured Dokdonia sp. TaxID=575653 RepID=UPI0026180474|nr:hypothetical protein [uncultured Dokdonia sp.]